MGIMRRQRPNRRNVGFRVRVWLVSSSFGEHGAMGLEGFFFNTAFNTVLFAFLLVFLVGRF